ncbi:Hypothetical predicted protein [Mytilus galloprovincialis]|uniref:Plasmin n=2 Tax=Mytilus galloprovincialis TaxID=29158 RepID=A0A8B6G7H9_MYTGA|nr:Hypothetical predicted protein [Mytilus galloprovincialis]
MESSPLLGQQDCGESNMAVEGDDSCLSIKPVPRYSQSIGSTIRFDCEARSNTMSEAKFGYCPVQVCQLNGTWSTASLSCAKNECIATGKHYNGRRVCTKSGIPCQSWTSQVPHSHGFVYGDVFPDKTIEHAGRTCRDPGFLRGSPWCYTQDNYIEWDFCDIPKCQVDCGLPDFQLRADNECVSLAPLDTFETTEGSALIYKCAKLQEGVMSFNNYCPVEVCQANGTWSPAYVSCAENECYVGGKSREYNGKRICTSNGLQCKPWNELKDKAFNLHSFPDETIQSAGLYCRDPDGERGSPWCYTDNVLWDYCSVPKCSEILTEEFICRETEATTVTIPSNMLDTTVVYAPRVEIENNQPVDQEFTTYVTKIVDDKKVTRPDNLEQSTFYTTASPTTNAQDMYFANWFATDKIQTNDDLPHQLQTAETTKVVESSKTGWHVETGEKYQTKELMETSKKLTTFAWKDETEYFQISSALDTTTANSQMTQKTAGAQVQTNGIKYETKLAHISEVTDISKDETKPAHISEATDISKDVTKPAHISQATDISKDETKPAHISEATDISKDETKPAHILKATYVSKDETKLAHISEATDLTKDETKPAHISEATDVSKDETKPAHISEATDVSKDETKPAHISEATDVSKYETGTSPNITSLDQLMTTKINEAFENSRVNKVTKDLMSVQSATVDNIHTFHSTKYSPDHDLTTLDDNIETMKIKVGRTENPTFFISQSIKGTPTNIAVERTYKYLSEGTEQTEPKNGMYTEVPESMLTITDDISSKTTAPIDGLLHTTEMIEMVKHIKQDKTTDQVKDSDQHTFKENIINHINDNNEQTTALYDHIASVSAMTSNNKLEDELSKEARTFPLLDGNIANDANDPNVDYEHGSSVNERQRDSVTANAQAGTIQKYVLGVTTRNTMSSSHFVSTIDDPITKQIETNSNNQHKIEASTANIWTRQSIENNRVHMAYSSSSHEDTTPESKPKLERPIDKGITLNSTTNIKSKPYKSETASNNIIKCQTGSVLFTQFRKAAVESHQIQRLLSQRNILDCARVCRSNSDCVLFRYIAEECTIFGSDYMGGETINCSSDQSCYRRIK